MTVVTARSVSESICCVGIDNFLLYTIVKKVNLAHSPPGRLDEL